MQNINIPLDALNGSLNSELENILGLNFDRKKEISPLKIINELVKMMKGSIRVNSEKEQNTTFMITIPHTDSENADNENTATDTQFKLDAYPTKDSFLRNVKNIIEENIEDEEFGITALCKAIGYSRSQLHNKIKADSGLSTSIFIRQVRLKKAKFLLENTSLNISEVTYEVGFKDPSYFSRLYHQMYGVSPSKVNAA